MVERDQHEHLPGQDSAQQTEEKRGDGRWQREKRDARQDTAGWSVNSEEGRKMTNT